MTEKTQTNKTEKEADIREISQAKKESKQEVKHEHHEHEHEHKHEENKLEEKKSETKKKEPTKHNIIKKEEAVARGLAMHASKKHCMYICTFIKNKPVDQAISDLEQVIKFKKPIPFKGEIPHRKGKGIMSGRYPIKTSALFIKLLKGLKGNILINGMDLEKTRIYFASANWASRPLRGEGRKAKRTNVLLKAKEQVTPQRVLEQERKLAVTPQRVLEQERKLAVSGVKE